MVKKTLNPVIIEIRPSKLILGEIGLFSSRKLTKDSVIAEAEKLGENFYTWEEYKKLDNITKKKVRDYCLQTQDGFYAPEDFNYLTVPWNMNHSCGYNVGFDNFGNFITTKNIKKGEELTWDYGMGISDPKYKLQCKCNSKNCRKLITGNDWKDYKFVEINKKYFMRELLVKSKQI